MGASEVTAADTLQLVSSTDTNLSSAAWYTTAVPVLGGFQTEFQWTMSGGLTGGFGFVLENSSSGISAFGGTSSYGYGGITPSVAVIFSAVDNEVLIESGGDTSSPIAAPNQ